MVIDIILFVVAIIVIGVAFRVTFFSKGPDE